jgi:hypothetical protein
MQFLKTLFWVVLAVVMVLFALTNWTPITGQPLGRSAGGYQAAAVGHRRLPDRLPADLGALPRTGLVAEAAARGAGDGPCCQCAGNDGAQIRAVRLDPDEPSEI